MYGNLLKIQNSDLFTKKEKLKAFIINKTKIE